MKNDSKNTIPHKLEFLICVDRRVGFKLTIKIFNMKYNITLRDKNGNLYKTNNGKAVTDSSFSFEDNDADEDRVRLICQLESEQYEAIVKEGTDITIEVSDFNSISDTWMVLYSYYHTEKRFVKH